MNAPTDDVKIAQNLMYSQGWREELSALSAPSPADMDAIIERKVTEGVITVAVAAALKAEAARYVEEYLDNGDWVEDYTNDASD